MTLEDAYNGLLQYWRSRPNGGTRAELLALAVQRGFEEPLLAVWLDLFLQGFVDVGWLDAPDYDAALAPRVAEVGYDRAAKAASVVFNLLTQTGSTLYHVRLQATRTALVDRIAALKADLTSIDDGIALALTTMPAGARRAALLAAAAVGRAQQARTIITAEQGLAEIDQALGI